MTLLLIKIVFWLFFCIFIISTIVMLTDLPTGNQYGSTVVPVISIVIIWVFFEGLHCCATIAYPRETRALDDYVGNVLSSMKYFIIQQKIIYLNKQNEM